MANGDISFPKISDSSWWKLRNLFKQKVPTTLTTSYLATALSMGEDSARANVVSPFIKIGIIGDDKKPTDLAYDWRDDHKYAAVCSALIEKLYPQELKDLFHTSDVDFQKLTGWFMNSARCGEAAAKQFARFYLLLLKADLTESETSTKKESSPKAAAPKSKAAAVKPKKETSLATKAPSVTNTTTTDIEVPDHQRHVKTVFSNSPELHINIQLHISPESSADQIDKIFESMAKHLKDFNR